MTAEAAHSGNTNPPGATLQAWATGGAAFCACADLLVAVLMGLEEVPLRAAIALPLAAVAYLGFGTAALAWSGRIGTVISGIWQLAVAAAIWFVLPTRLGTAVPPVFQWLMILHAAAAAVAFAGAASQSRDGRLRRRVAGAAAHATAENLDAVLVAIVFALVIRSFAVEAYKIPTESMSPNLLGEDARRGPGDRVLVEKWSTFFGGPSRFEIWVFRPPLERDINYVKRVAGLPGEYVEIEDGDLYVDGTIARKPERILEDMWCSVYPSAHPRTAGAGEEALPWSGEGFRRDGEDGFRVTGADGTRLLGFAREVRDGEFDGGANPVGDVRVRFDVSSVEPGSDIKVRLVGRAGPVETTLLPGGGGTVGCGGESRAIPDTWDSIQTVEVRFVDLEIVVVVNGEIVHRSDAVPLPPRERPKFSVGFGVGKGGAVFRDVRLDRDIFYVSSGRTRFDVPEGHYLFLGDNSRRSKDSREWKAWVIREMRDGGEVFHSDNRPSPGDAPGTLGFKDRSGIYRVYPAGEITVSSGQEPLSFVPRGDLHGRAFAVFWPPSWQSKVKNRVRMLP